MKVEFEEGIIGKAIVSPNLKIKRGESRVKISDEEWMEKIGEMLKEGEESKQEKLKLRNSPQPVQKATSSDFFLALVLALLVMGILLILSYLLFS